jgi:uncharacterized protein (TIGR03382 family)
MNPRKLVVLLALLAMTIGVLPRAYADYAPAPPEPCPDGSQVGDACGADGTCEDTMCDDGSGAEFECIGCVEPENSGCSAAGPVAKGTASLVIVVSVSLLLWVRRRT